MKFVRAASCMLLSCTLQLVHAAPAYLPEQSARQEEIQKRGLDARFDSQLDGVTIIFDSADVGDHVVHIPLNQRIPTRRSDNLVTLPTHPEKARILGHLTTKSVQIGGTFDMDTEDSTPNVSCTAHPKIEEHPYTWTARDGQINFEDEHSKMYLDGREVASYECSII